MLREELKRLIEKLNEDIENEEGRRWEKNKDYIKKLEERIERLTQLYSDLDY